MVRQFWAAFNAGKYAVMKDYNVLKEDSKTIYSELDAFFWDWYNADLVDKHGVRWYIAD